MSESPDNVEEPVDEPEVRDLTISDAFNLGANIVFLRTCGTLEHRVGSVEQSGVLHSLELVQNKLVATRVGLTVASQIEEVKSAIYDIHGQEPNPNDPIDDSLGDEISKRAETWEQLLSENLANETRIKIPNRGILYFEQLMYEPNRLFEEKVWEAMDATPKNDISEACRALPMGCTTASLMVSLRSVEHYLRKWHENKTGDELERGTWGSVLDNLIDIYTAEEDQGAPVIQQLSSVPSVLSNIYYLKERRNKVAHPDESPSDYEAVITLFMVSGTISDVCREMGEVTIDSERISQ